MLCREALGWFAGGMSPFRLSRLAEQRGLGFKIDEVNAKILLSAGVDAVLVQDLRKSTTAGVTGDSACPAELAKTSALIRARKFDLAQPTVEKLSNKFPDDASLKFALGLIHQQLEQWDPAFDAYSDARDLAPDSSDVHCRLSYVFYRYGDGDNAIAEARTALSLDPKN